MADLVTLAQVQTALPLLSAAELAYVPALISGVSSFIAGRYPRIRPPATYDEEHETGTDRNVTLANRPILSIDGVFTDNDEFIRITRTADSSADARVSLTATADGTTATGVQLDSWAFGESEGTHALDFVTYKSIQALGDAINALPGWSATINPGLGKFATASLRPVQGGFGATGSGAALRGYKRRLEDYACDRGQGTLVVREWKPEGYRHPDRTWGQDARASTLRVIYTAGTATPPDVQAAVMVLINDALQSTANPGTIAAESSEDYSIRLASGDRRMPALARSYLSRYRERRIS